MSEGSIVIWSQAWTPRLRLRGRLTGQDWGKAELVESLVYPNMAHRLVRNEHKAS